MRHRFWVVVSTLGGSVLGVYGDKLNQDAIAQVDRVNALGEPFGAFLTSIEREWPQRPRVGDIIHD